MKRVLSIPVLAFMSMSANGADNPGFSGKYKINLTLPGHENPFFCVFTQNNQVLGGYCNTEAGSASVLGKVDGQNVSWSYTVKVSGMSFTANYKGTFDVSAKVSGSMTLPGMPSGIPFTATPSK